MMSGPELIFYVVLSLGAIALMFVNLKARKTSVSGVPPALPVEPLVTKTDLVGELLTGPVLSAEPGRQWLDRLLDQQQADEPKK